MPKWYDAGMAKKKGNSENAIIDRLKRTINDGLTEFNLPVLNARLSLLPSPVVNGEEYISPVGADAVVSSPYAWRNIPNPDGTNNHRATDFRRADRSQRDVPLVAMKSGTVIFVGQWEVASGRSVFIRFDDGTIGTYSHTQEEKSPTVAVGQHVAQGQRIATMGNTGNVISDVFRAKLLGKPVRYVDPNESATTHVVIYEPKLPKGNVAPPDVIGDVLSKALGLNDVPNDATVNIRQDELAGYDRVPLQLNGAVLRRDQFVPVSPISVAVAKEIQAALQIRPTKPFEPVTLADVLTPPPLPTNADLVRQLPSLPKRR